VDDKFEMIAVEVKLMNVIILMGKYRYLLSYKRCYVGD
jgi:hypothetical protein